MIFKSCLIAHRLERPNYSKIINTFEEILKDEIAANGKQKYRFELLDLFEKFSKKEKETITTQTKNEINNFID